MDFPSPNWQFYDLLIESVPLKPQVADAAFSRLWVAIKSSSGGTGLAHILPSKGRKAIPDPSSLLGVSLRDLAGRAKSWDPLEAAIGLAAVTAAANSALLAAGLTAQSPEARKSSAFDHWRHVAENKKVAVIGRFPGLEKLKSVAKELSVLEIDPQPGELPDTAAEYVLPGMDAIFITGSSLANKTFPRLLALSANSWLGLVGPSVPLVPLLFNKYSIDSLSGTVFDDFPRIAQAIQLGHATSLYNFGGFRVNLGPAFGL
jgi:uncharacterized protein (DUF4213/DUF364 family)